MMNDKFRASLLKLSIKARSLDRAIGQWWFGPTAGTYFILNLRSDRIEAGKSGMSLDELASWFARLDRRNESMQKIEVASDRNRRINSPSVRVRATLRGVAADVKAP